MNISINGDAAVLPEGTTVAQLIQERTGQRLTPEGTLEDGRRLGLAVALGEDVVPRSQWHSTVLTEGSRVEIVTAVQGG